MTCKVCGRVKRLLIPYRIGIIIEPLCWTCRYWLDTGKVYEMR